MRWLGNYTTSGVIYNNVEFEMLNYFSHFQRIRIYIVLKNSTLHKILFVILQALGFDDCAF